MEQFDGENSKMGKIAEEKLDSIVRAENSLEPVRNALDHVNRVLMKESGIPAEIRVVDLPVPPNSEIAFYELSGKRGIIAWNVEKKLVVDVVSFSTGMKKTRIAVPSATRITCVKLLFEGEYLALSNELGLTLIYNLESGERILEFFIIDALLIEGWVTSMIGKDGVLFLGVEGEDPENDSPGSCGTVVAYQFDQIVKGNFEAPLKTHFKGRNARLFNAPQKGEIYCFLELSAGDPAGIYRASAKWSPLDRDRTGDVSNVFLVELKNFSLKNPVFQRRFSRGSPREISRSHCHWASVSNLSSDGFHFVKAGNLLMQMDENCNFVAQWEDLPRLNPTNHLQTKLALSPDGNLLFLHHHEMVFFLNCENQFERCLIDIGLCLEIAFIDDGRFVALTALGNGNYDAVVCSRDFKIISRLSESKYRMSFSPDAVFVGDGSIVIGDHQGRIRFLDDFFSQTIDPCRFGPIAEIVFEPCRNETAVLLMAGGSVQYQDKKRIEFLPPVREFKQSFSPDSEANKLFYGLDKFWGHFYYDKVSSLLGAVKRLFHSTWKISGLDIIKVTTIAHDVIYGWWLARLKEDQSRILGVIKFRDYLLCLFENDHLDAFHLKELKNRGVERYSPSQITLPDECKNIRAVVAAGAEGLLCLTPNRVIAAYLNADLSIKELHSAAVPDPLRVLRAGNQRIIVICRDVLRIFDRNLHHEIARLYLIRDSFFIHVPYPRWYQKSDRHQGFFWTPSTIPIQDFLELRDARGNSIRESDEAAWKWAKSFFNEIMVQTALTDYEKFLSYLSSPSRVNYQPPLLPFDSTKRNK